MNKNNIYWIGGSPCCGKSTISEKLVKEYGFKYYKCDDHLERYMTLGAQEHHDVMLRFSTMTTDETWLRNVHDMVEDEFEFYRYAVQVIVNDLETFSEDDRIIVEGAALLPDSMYELAIPSHRYLCMTPEHSFQVAKYEERTWVKDYLSDCSDYRQAFKNWMSRDAAFASIVKERTKELNYVSIEIDGSQSIDEVYKIVKKHFELS